MTTALLALLTTGILYLLKVRHDSRAEIGELRRQIVSLKKRLRN